MQIMQNCSLPNLRNSMERSTRLDLNIRLGLTSSRPISRRLKNTISQEPHGRRVSTSLVTSLKQNLRRSMLVDTSDSQCQRVTLPLSLSPPRIFRLRLTGGSKESSLMLRTRDNVDLAGLSAPLR